MVATSRHVISLRIDGNRQLELEVAAAIQKPRP